MGDQSYRGLSIRSIQEQWRQRGQHCGLYFPSVCHSKYIWSLSMWPICTIMSVSTNHIILLWLRLNVFLSSGSICRTNVQGYLAYMPSKACEHSTIRQPNHITRSPLTLPCFPATSLLEFPPEDKFIAMLSNKKTVLVYQTLWDFTYNIVGGCLWQL